MSVDSLRSLVYSSLALVVSEILGSGISVNVVRSLPWWLYIDSYNGVFLGGGGGVL